MEEADKITYSESRTINVGQYENVNTFFSYTGTIKHFNRVDKTVEIKHMETTTLLRDDKADFKDTAKQLMKRVQRVLNTREREVRLKSMDFVNDTYLENKAELVPDLEDCL